MQESNRNIIIALLETNSIKEENVEKALYEVGVIPTSQAWYGFMDKLLLWFGGLALAFALLFFVAYNWTEFGRFGKFALVEGALLLSVGLYWYLGGESMSAKVTLFVSSILLGVLLALVGQTYQTGADTWQLFFYWAILMLPWAFAGRFPALWLLWVFLINVSILIYMETFRGFLSISFYSEYSMLWALFSFNTVVWVIWELLAKRYIWLNEAWAVRILGFVSMVSVTWLTLNFLWDDGTPLAFLVLAFWLVAVYLHYRVRKVDLFMLALFCFSFSIIVVSILISYITSYNFDLFSILFIGMVIIGLGAGSASWLKSVQKEASDAK